MAGPRQRPCRAGEGLRARHERQRSHVRIVSGAPEKRVPTVPGLWRVDFPGWIAPMMVHSPAECYLACKIECRSGGQYWKSIDTQAAKYSDYFTASVAIKIADESPDVMVGTSQRTSEVCRERARYATEAYVFVCFFSFFTRCFW